MVYTFEGGKRKAHGVERRFSCSATKSALQQNKLYLHTIVPLGWIISKANLTDRMVLI